MSVLPEELRKSSMKVTEVGPIAWALQQKGFQFDCRVPEDEPDLFVLSADGTVADVLSRMLPSRRYWALLISTKSKAFENSGQFSPQL